ncbi:HAD superfamily hydrolase (TIGR01490 family) [Chitinophaga skermanii]|uniref:HAD superfamily hydrolase (TIGR01490 family) n=1 Tax=Chitinophaga skermanii TaxID=331697 RepID=A0A327QS66_9BACT|nr:HAD family hydrolase [Chitinophaga skermanii]RAJ06735.1 HAD superfamily hydrolase (TIGR01490 family) [Chitinophaga skermanii]
MNPGIAFFDFDGTITTKDTLFEMARFQRSKQAYWKGLFTLLPTFVAVKLKLIPAAKGKEKMLTYFLGGTSERHFNMTCRDFCRNILPNYIRPQAITAITKHLSEGHDVVVVTASAENWVQPWCDSLGIQCIGTKLEVAQGKFTGRIAGENCNGAEKVNRIRAAYDLANYEQVFAYGDTSGDKPMLALAKEGFFKPFRN